MSDSNKDLIITKYLALLDVPKTEWPRQREKLSHAETGELRSELEALERVFSKAEGGVIASNELWEVEEAERRSLLTERRDCIQEWLFNALMKHKLGHDDAFAPYQDQIGSNHVTDGLYRFFLSITRAQRKNWICALVEVTADELREAPADRTTVELLHLVSRLDSLAALAAKHVLAPELLAAHRDGRLEIPVRLRLDIYTTACATFPRDWLRLNRLVELEFEEALMLGELSRRDFERVGQDLAQHLPTEDLWAMVGRVRITKWREAAFAATFAAASVLSVRHSSPCGIELPNFDPDLMNQKIEELVAA